MASIQQRGSKFQLRVVSKLLARPFFFTFPTREEAGSYGQQLEALLARGIVPRELLERPQRADDPMFCRIAGEYAQQFPLTDSDDALLSVRLYVWRFW